MTLRVLVTGSDGYIGSILSGLLRDAGHEVVGCDNFMFEECSYGDDNVTTQGLRKDIRDLTRDDLDGFEAVCHLAGISNDPIGDLRPELTYEINHQASVQLARLASEANVERFIFSSSCSIYGTSPGSWVDEDSELNPVTPYALSKIKVEEDVRLLASDDFSPVFLRNATAYGLSPKLRTDLVLNNLVGYAVTQGRVLMKSDGSPWRPLVHAEDISRAFVAVLEAPREAIHNRAFNVGATSENYQISDVAGIVERTVPGAVVELAGTAGPDIRDYRVNCDRIAEAVPAFRPQWTVEDGARQLYETFTSLGLDESDFLESFVRLEHIKRQQAAGVLTEDLRVMAGTGA